MKRNYKTTPGEKIEEQIAKDDHFIAILAIIYVIMMGVVFFFFN